MSVNIKTVKDALFDWVSTVVSVDTEVIFLRPNEFRPFDPDNPQFAQSYVTINLSTVLEKIGQDSLRHKDETVFEVKGQRTMNVSLVAYSENARQIMVDLQTSLEKPSVLAKLRDNGLAIWNEPTVTDVSALLETGFETRAAMDVTMAVSSLDTDEVGAIENVEMEGTIGDQTVDLDLNS